MYGKLRGAGVVSRAKVRHHCIEEGRQKVLRSKQYRHDKLTAIRSLTAITLSRPSAARVIVLVTFLPPSSWARWPNFITTLTSTVCVPAMLLDVCTKFGTALQARNAPSFARVQIRPTQARSRIRHPATCLRRLLQRECQYYKALTDWREQTT